MANKKNGNDYYEMFVSLVNYSCQAAEGLHHTLVNFNPESLPETMASMHGIEHAADDEKHTVLERLTREFMPPIEREDIVALTQEIDEVTDTVEDVLLKIYMYNIQTIRDDAIVFARTIADCCDGMKIMMEEFRNFKHSKIIHDQIVEINRLEEVGDKLYTDAVHKLYTEPNVSPKDLFAWTLEYSRLERCCDACEPTANLVETIIMKNS